MFRFESPHYLQWLVSVPAFLLMAWVLWRMNRLRVAKSFHARMMPVLMQNLSTTKRWTKLSLQLCALALSILALARPQMGEGRQEVKSQGLEMVVAIDVSRSMLSEDMKPSRLEHAKKQIEKLLDQLSGDKVGLVAFAGTAVTLSPLTSDYSAIRIFLDSLRTDTVSNQGTRFLPVIKEAGDLFRRGGLTEEDGAQVSRVLLLVTDGEDHEPGALKAAEEAKARGIRLFALGLGTKKGAPIPERDDRGYLLGYKKDKNGQIVMTTARTEVLEQLAAAGGGGYYHSTFSGEEIQAFKNDLNKLQRADLSSEAMTLYNEKFQIFLGLALFFAALEMIFSERRSQGRIWKGRFEVAQP